MVNVETSAKLKQINQNSSVAHKENIYKDVKVK